KKPGAKKHTPPARPVLRTGSAEPAGFSERASCPRGKRCTSMCGAPAGSDPPPLPLRRGPNVKIKPRRAGLDPPLFRRHQDPELSRRDGASHLSLLVQRNLAQ